MAAEFSYSSPNDFLPDFDVEGPSSGSLAADAPIRPIRRRTSAANIASLIIQGVVIAAAPTLAIVGDPNTAHAQAAEYTVTNPFRQTLCDGTVFTYITELIYDDPMPTVLFRVSGQIPENYVVPTAVPLDPSFVIDAVTIPDVDDNCVNPGQQVHTFLTTRAARLISNGPGVQRLMDRLSDNEPQPQRSLKDDTGPMKLGRREPDPRDGTEGPASFAASLSRMRLGADGDPAAPYLPHRFDIWVEGDYQRFDFDAALSEGHFGVVKLGIDYKVAPGLLVGIMAQYDTTSFDSSAAGLEIDGDGWMVGPYAAARLSQHVFLDGRLLWGGSDNDMESAGTTGSFSTDRFLASARLSGRWEREAWLITPSAEIVYFQDESESFTDSAGTNVASQKAELGRFTAGPRVGYRIQRDDGVLMPYGAARVVWDFIDPDAVRPDTGADLDLSRINAQFELGLRMSWTSGASAEVGATYEGLGGDYDATGVRAAVTIPLN